MKLIGYYRSAPDPNGRAVIEEYLSRRSLGPLLILNDEGREYSSFRKLQNLVKLRACDHVVIPSGFSLGEDGFISLENRMFFERNGVKLVVAGKDDRDERHAILLGIKRMFSYPSEWDSDYGISMPLRNSKNVFSRVPPFGYKVVEGEAVIDPEEAEAVKMVFKTYDAGASIAKICSNLKSFRSARGLPFTNMTVKTVLRNERYLGRRSKKGYHLPSIITYDVWLKAHERLDRDYPTESETEPVVSNVLCDRKPLFYRSLDTLEYYKRCMGFEKCRPIDSDALDKSLFRIIAKAATEEIAKSLIRDYITPYAARAKEALKKATYEYNFEVAESERGLRRIIAGDRSPEIQNSVEASFDRKTVYGMRLRRIRSEIELCSVTDDMVFEFFERARRMESLSAEEKRFIADTFIYAVRMKDGKTLVYLRLPDRKRLKKILL